MKKVFVFAFTASLLFLTAACQLDFIDENNPLCRDCWQVESVSTYAKDGQLIGFEDMLYSGSYVAFFYTGAWLFESEMAEAPEYGVWSTEIVPLANATFDVIMISENPGFFIKEGHSGEVYKFNIYPSGDTLSILHKHVDEDDYSVTRFISSSHVLKIENSSKR